MQLELKLDLTKKYVVSVSGGVDSMVLLDLLRINNYDFIVVHFDHQVRATSYLDAQLVKEYCIRYNLEYLEFKLGDYGANFQSSARAKRNAHLQDVAFKDEAIILTAHHQDDHLETIVMNEAKKKSLDAQGGLKKEIIINGYTYIKPLLEYCKNDIYEYANKNNIPFNEDETNLDETYLRNKIRIELKEILVDEFVRERMLVDAEKKSKLHQEIRKQTTTFLRGKSSFDIDLFLNLDKNVQEDVIALLLERGQKIVSKVFIDEIIKKMTSPKPNITIDLNDNFQFVKEYNLFSLESVKSNTPRQQLIALTSLKQNEHEKDYAVLCYNNLDTPLTLRDKKLGDILQFSYGTKKLKDFLIDKKVPMKQRDDLKVVVDQNDLIVWIPNLYLNQTLGSDNKLYLKLKDEDING